MEESIGFPRNGFWQNAYFWSGAALSERSIHFHDTYEAVGRNLSDSFYTELGQLVISGG